MVDLMIGSPIGPLHSPVIGSSRRSTIALVLICSFLALSAGYGSANELNPNASNPANPPEGSVETPPCSLPICDQARAQTEFRAASQQIRFRSLQDHTARASHLTDAAALGNLLVFAEATKAILIEVNEEFWMIESARNLEALCVSRLARYSPLNADGLIGFFRRLPYESTRNDVLTYWQGRIRDFEDRESLLEMARFFSRAHQICVEADDDDYVYATARTAEQAINAKLMRLHPFFEGVFDVDSACGDSSCPTGLIDKIVIIDTLSLENLQISMVNSRMGSIVYNFTNVIMTDGATTFEGVVRGNASRPLARLRFQFDLATRRLNGTLETTERVIPFTARAAVGPTPVQFFERQDSRQRAEPIAPAFFERTFRGTFGDQAGQLRITVLNEETVGGSLTLDAFPGFRVRFNTGRFFPRRGIVVLAGSGPGGGTIKLTVAISGDPAGTENGLVGSSLSALNGRINGLEMR